MAINNPQISSDLHILMFPFAAFGHISPFLHLSNKLSSFSGVRISFLSTPANLNRISSLLPFSSTVQIICLPLPSVPGLPSAAESTADIPPQIAQLLKIAVDRMRPAVAALIAELRPDIIFFDFAQQWIPAIAHPLGVKTVFFSVFSAAATAYLTVPERAAISSHAELTSPPAGFPTSTALSGGVPAYQAKDFAHIFHSPADASPSVYDRVLACLARCSAVAAKTCTELESPYIHYIESQLGKPVLLAGPVVPDPPAGQLGPDWAGFLDRFDPGTLVFCSFGSETTLREDAIAELLSGLELAGVPYLTVLNGGGALTENAAGGGGRGMVRQGWAPQQLILRHRSVGCFVCHAGLSSVVEGVVAGCRVVMLPQRGDQYLNARLFAGDLGVGVEVERDGSGGFGREGVRDAVVRAMGRRTEGEERRAEELRGFLMDGEVQGRFMEEFVGKLKELVSSCK